MADYIVKGGKGLNLWIPLLTRKPTGLAVGFLVNKSLSYQVFSAPNRGLLNVACLVVPIVMAIAFAGSHDNVLFREAKGASDFLFLAFALLTVSGRRSAAQEEHGHEQDGDAKEQGAKRRSIGNCTLSNAVLIHF
jgi:hypothetical protein